MEANLYEKMSQNWMEFQSIGVVSLIIIIEKFERYVNDSAIGTATTECPRKLIKRMGKNDGNLTKNDKRNREK